jgi:hypothetical protein
MRLANDPTSEHHAVERIVGENSVLDAIAADEAHSRASRQAVGPDGKGIVVGVLCGALGWVALIVGVLVWFLVR